ncbi:MAG: hypothetical protein JSR61_00385 [Proteobacteria bacterium]|nr:hypothetical protein [Pseudomonadota bacterium]
MKSYIAFLLSTAAILAVAGPVQAAPASLTVPAAQSYADLLEPVQNAREVLMADDLAQANQPRPLLQLAQWHHHHHHHRYYHHHHHGFFPGFGITVGPPAYYGPDCYYQRRVYINRWGERVVRRVRVCD